MNLNQLHAALSVKQNDKHTAEIYAVLLKSYVEEHIGGEWQARAWKNSGWNIAIYIRGEQHGCIYLSVNQYLGTPTIFRAMITTGEHEGGADNHWFERSDADRDPVVAIDKAMKRAKDWVKEQNKILNHLSFKMMQVSNIKV